MKLKSKKKHKKPDVWTAEIRVKDKNETRALRELIRLVKKYEEIS